MSEGWVNDNPDKFSDMDAFSKITTPKSNGLSRQDKFAPTAVPIRGFKNASLKKEKVCV
jgi:hypothetical protein